MNRNFTEKNDQDKPKDKPMPMVVHYKSLFTKDQIKQSPAVQRLLGILIAMVFHVMGWVPYNSYLQLIGASGWCYVAWRWNEKSLLLNFLPQFFIIIPGLIYLWLK